MNDAEDCRVRADPEREREHNDQRERCVLPKKAQRESKILLPLAEHFANAMRASANRRAPRRVGVKLIWVAEPAKRFGTSVGLIHAQRMELIGTHLEMDAHFVGQLAYDSFRAPRQREESTDRYWQE